VFTPYTSRVSITNRLAVYSRCSVVLAFAGLLAGAASAATLTITPAAIYADTDAPCSNPNGAWPSCGSNAFVSGTVATNNTVFMNAATGVSCSEAYSILASVVYGNSGPSQIAGCMTTTPCCGTSDPLLDATYHLMSTSPCIDKLTATMTTPATDVDGQPFPTAAGKLDCGADQYVAP